MRSYGIQDNINYREAIEKDQMDQKKFDQIKQNQLVIDNLKDQVHYISTQNDGLITILYEMTRQNDRNSFFTRHFTLLRREKNLFSILKRKSIYFIDGIILGNKVFKKHSIISISKIIPNEGYFEYRVEGYGDRIYFYIISNIGAKLFLEVVHSGKIIKQEIFEVKYIGMYCSILPMDIKGKAFIRFKAMDYIGLSRVLEIHNRKLLFFAKRSFAYFIE